ncbi:MAG: S1 RNA-binding domain-containing protein [Phascolarctobacterium faecium]
MPFGAIVKLADKVEGLVHVSEIAETRVENRKIFWKSVKM